MRPETDHIMPDSSSDSASFCVDSSSLELETGQLLGEQTDIHSEVARLQKDLEKTLALLAQKEEKCQELIQLQQSTDSELHNLTEQLFTEAYKLVDEEKAQRILAEKRYNECKLKVDVLEGEVEGLKTVVKGKRSIAQRFLSPGPSSPERIRNPFSRKNRSLSASRSMVSFSEPVDVVQQDPQLFEMFIQWREDKFSLKKDSEFMQRVIDEDIRPCLLFRSKKLAEEVFRSIQANELEMEKVRFTENETTCALTETWKPCPYKLKVNLNSEWKYISIFARNRIAAVCDFYTYIRYLSQGLVQSELSRIYFHLLGLRRNILLTKLGFPLESTENLRSA
ncbi:unnamed protein product [Bursaphelenchus okinawaensis]|uniref:Sec2p domain-containing protein n=1 Tax=Bursaphelenchus okinawaensis TaxID=465554 RepID=A0A811K9D0_9BILA|nr:unnamed protein product [Bursaphelenchus okinawaensis]CAG9095051.1 unnamed protein product [Bursaphelenchus okinawaensis]